MVASATAQWEGRANGSATNGGAFVWFSLINSTYKWTASGSGTDEYYIELVGGGDPSFVEAQSVQLDGFFNLATNGTLGSLNASEWDWGDNDSLGFSTVYVRLADGADPDSKADDFVGMGKTGGKDYSQQDAAQQRYTAITVLTSTTATATPAFTSLVNGNYIHIDTGTNAVVGWHEILSESGGTVTFATDIVTSGTPSDLEGDLGGAIIPEDTPLEATAAGNTIHVKNDGTYTAALNVAKDGLVDVKIQVIGNNSTRGDLTRETAKANRPLFATGSGTFNFDNFWTTKNIRLTTSSSDGWDMDAAALADNCFSHNYSSSAGREAFNFTSTSSSLISSEGQCDLGRALQCSSSITVLDCYLHDSDIGIIGFSVDTFDITSCVFERCATAGVKIDGTNAFHRITHCDFYKNGVGIDGGAGTSYVIFYNIFDNNTTGILFDASNSSNYGDFNNFFNNGTDKANFTDGVNSIALDPEFVAPDGITYTDLVSDGASPSVISSVSRPFKENIDEALALELVDGITDFTDGLYSIATVDGSDNATLQTGQDTGNNATGGHFILSVDRDWNVGPNMSIDIKHPSTGSVFHLTIGAFPRAANDDGGGDIIIANRGGFR